MKILIVEDEKLARKSLEKQILSLRPKTEILAQLESVQETVDWLKKNEADLLFLDIHLANGDGFQVLESLKNKRQNVIFVTGHEEHAVKAFRSEAVDYLLKPVCIEHLQGAVERVRTRTSSDKNEGKSQISLSHIYFKEDDFHQMLPNNPQLFSRTNHLKSRQQLCDRKNEKQTFFV